MKIRGKKQRVEQENEIQDRHKKKIGERDK
jgi:hypothetical protein